MCTKNLQNVTTSQRDSHDPTLDNIFVFQLVCGIDRVPSQSKSSGFLEIQ